MVVRIYFTIVIRYAIASRMKLHIYSLGLLVFVVVVSPRPTDRPTAPVAIIGRLSECRSSSMTIENLCPPARYTYSCGRPVCPHYTNCVTVSTYLPMRICDIRVYNIIILYRLSSIHLIPGDVNTHTNIYVLSGPRCCTRTETNIETPFTAAAIDVSDTLYNLNGVK